MLDHAQVYFGARLSEKWPTVEVRTVDVALHVEDAVTAAGLVRGLVETAACDRYAPPEVATEVLRLAAWRAGRSGLTGALVHPLTGRPAPAADSCVPCSTMSARGWPTPTTNSAWPMVSPRC